MNAGLSIHNIENTLADAFQEDLEKLLHEYEKCQNLDIEDFAKIWKDMDFSLIFSGQTLAAEVKVFTEMCFAIVLKYLLFSESIYLQAGALYTLYGLYYKQPLVNWIKIRVTYDDIVQLKQFISDTKSKGGEALLYVYAKLRTDNAFKYVAKEAILAPEVKFQKHYDVSVGNNIKDNVRKVSMTLKDLFESNELNDLEALDKEYQEGMKKFTEKHPRTPLIVFGSSMPKELSKIYEEHQVETPVEKDETTVVKRRRLIRKKAQENISDTYKTQKLTQAAARAAKHDKEKAEVTE